MYEQLKDSPPAHAACLSTELIAKARECEVAMPEYNALLDRLAKADYVPPKSKAGASQVSFGLVASSGGGGGGGGSGGNGGNTKVAARPGGRAPVRTDGKQKRTSSLRKGESQPSHYYGQAVDLLGPDFSCMEHFLTELDKHLTQTLKKPHGPFCRRNGAFVFPLRLMDGYQWKAEREHHNFNLRRDFYGLWQLLRDLFSAGTPSNRQGKLSKVGEEYIAANPGKHADWKALTPAEFMAKFKRATSPTPFKDTPVTIAGESVMQFRA